MQPAPKPNDTQPIHEQVIEDIKRRAEVGKQNYGTYLQANNGRDSLLDAYEEAQDKALYLKQAILERDALVMELEVAREEVRRLSQANGDLRKERTALAAHDASLLRSLAAKLDGEGHPANEYYRNWLRAEADRIEQEAEIK